MGTTASGQALWLLDTNIISELIRPHPHPGVRQRFIEHEFELALPCMVWQELLYGLYRLPEGRRKVELTAFLFQVADALPKLAYDAAVAQRHAHLRAESAQRGRVLCEPDAHITAIALAHDLTLVTRNTRDFDGIPGLRLANWFEPAP